MWRNGERLWDRNTFVQGSLSILFVVLTLVVVITALIEVVKAKNGHAKESKENPYIESKLYAPAGMIATPAERELEAQWQEFYRKHPDQISGSAGHSGH